MNKKFLVAVALPYILLRVCLTIVVLLGVFKRENVVAARSRLPCILGLVILEVAKVNNSDKTQSDNYDGRQIDHQSTEALAHLADSQIMPENQSWVRRVQYLRVRPTDELAFEFFDAFLVAAPDFASVPA
jgi:hypothetical protein